jgi:hypothetical protein
MTRSLTCVLCGESAEAAALVAKLRALDANWQIAKRE